MTFSGKIPDTASSENLKFCHRGDLIRGDNFHKHLLSFSHHPQKLRGGAKIKINSSGRVR